MNQPNERRERVTQELADGVRATAVRHEIDTRGGLLDCWTFVLDEPFPLRFSLLRALTDAPEPPFAVARSMVLPCLVSLARGEALEPGAVLATEPSALARVSAVGLLPAVAFDPSDTLDERTLALVPLFDEEASVARARGLTRIAARLGEGAGHFPYPAWHDRARSTVARAHETSVLAFVPQGALRREPGAAVYVEGDAVVLRLPRASSPSLGAWLRSQEPDAPLALLTPPPRDADGLLVWTPGQDEARAIAPNDGDGTRVAGGLLVVARGAPEPSVNLVEDGFALHLDPPRAERFFNALVDGTEFSMPTGDNGLGARLVWTDPAARA